jgi:hypothetical protein
MSVNLKNGRERRPEVRSEDGPTVGDNCVGKPMQSYNMGDKELGEF